VKRTDVTHRLAALAAEHDLPDGSVDRFARLLDALAAEPDPHTTVADPDLAVDRHLADSLSGLQVDALRAAPSIADIGAGPGFPGLPLAVALPASRVDLIEAARRKCAVIERLAEAADVGNARALPFRAEEWGGGEGRGAYAAAVARAVAPLPVLLEYAAPLLRLGGAFVAWKGSRDPGEEAAGAAAGELVGLRAITVLSVTPYKSARALTLHLYLKERETPARFPRRPGVAAKHPLA
jgi:16S rRNA (guanine527-N7)-methyltransferase